jgi:Xaa-Pro dipeptidase
MDVPSPISCFGTYVPVSVKGVGRFRHSDTVLVTEDGCISLTRFPDSLKDLVLPMG